MYFKKNIYRSFAHFIPGFDLSDRYRLLYYNIFICIGLNEPVRMLPGQ